MVIRPPSRTRSISGKRSSATFANGAQVVIDQFISSARQKWDRMSGLTLFLPHGYEGQGPEHSSARLERYLQLCAHREHAGLRADHARADVPHAAPADAAQRAQAVDRDDPEIAACDTSSRVSTLDDLAAGAFQLVIADTSAKNAKKVRRVVLCSGKVQYDLIDDRGQTQGRRCRGRARRAALSVPAQGSRCRAAKYPAAKELVWCQEEPMNRGAWYQIKHHLQAVPVAQAVAELCGPHALAGSGVRTSQHPRRRAGGAGLAGAGRAAGTDYARSDNNMTIEVKVPVLPESVSDATIAGWHKKPGDAVKRDENLVDLETGQGRARSSRAGRWRAQGNQAGHRCDGDEPAAACGDRRRARRRRPAAPQKQRPAAKSSAPAPAAPVAARCRSYGAGRAEADLLRRGNVSRPRTRSIRRTFPAPAATAASPRKTWSPSCAALRRVRRRRRKRRSPRPARAPKSASR